MPIKYLNRNNNSTTISAGNSVQFNGSSQYLTAPSNALFSFGTGNFTVEGWIYLTELNRYNALFSNGAAVVGAVALYTFTNNKLSFAEYYGTDVNGTTTLSINTWYHVAVTRSGSTVRLFLNGNIENSNPSDSFNNTTNNLIIGEAWGTKMKGYISNFRVVKGTAVYTSNFTPSTSPLTAIANTSLLTCNTATIIDGSSNNFTITNNGSATVSATVPFTASISTPKGIKFKNRSNVGTATSTMKMKKVFADPYMIATGGDLITTSGSYKIHTFTTVGTSSFTISSIGITPSIEYLIVGGGGAGGSNNNCGGGGAGGLIYNTASLSVGAYAVTIGQSGSVASGVSNGNNGGNSTFNGLVAFGGGGGGGSTAGSNGGSGGGNGGGGFSGTGTVSAIGLQPTSSYGGFGNNGGASAGAGSYPGGGGGGAGAAGNNGSGATGGNGGNGKAYAFAGALTYYAGGGGGSLNPGTAGTGGLGGGGNGRSTIGVGIAATGYGSGGGGGLSAGSGGEGGAGSPGIILIKYRYTA